MEGVDLGKNTIQAFPNAQCSRLWGIGPPCSRHKNGRYLPVQFYLKKKCSRSDLYSEQAQERRTLIKIL